MIGRICTAKYKHFDWKLGLNIEKKKSRKICCIQKISRNICYNQIGTLAVKIQTIRTDIETQKIKFG